MTVIESPCASCGVDTTPMPPEPGTWHWYMVTDDVWEAAGMPRGPGDSHDGRGFLCLPCLADRLGRPVTINDLLDAPINVMPSWLDAPIVYSLKMRALAAARA